MLLNKNRTKNNTPTLFQMITLVFILFFSTTTLVQAQVYEDLTAVQCDSLINANIDNPNFVILDVRTPGEYNPQHLEGAINRNYYDGDFSTQLDGLNKDKKYLIHCLSGGRSGVTLGTMEGLGFTEVYNMLGGMNHWNANSFPTTTEFGPRIMLISESVFPNKTIALGTTDTIAITVTNRANSTLTFNSLSGLAHPEFSSDFDNSISLEGAEDYTFNIYYTPTDEALDVINFIIESNAGSVGFNIERIGQMILDSRDKTSNLSLQLFPNPTTQSVYFKNLNAEKGTVEIFNLFGQSVLKKEAIQLKEGINISVLQKGIYLLNMTTSSNKGTAVLIVE